MERLLAHPWRGNARELENVVERALALSDAETLGPDDVPLPGGPAPRDAGRRGLPGAAAAAHGMTLHELDERYTEQVLRAHGRQQGAGGAHPRHRPQDALSARGARSRAPPAAQKEE